VPSGPDEPNKDIDGDDIELDGAGRGTPEVIVTDFRIAGSPASDFHPGVSQAVDLVITNSSDRALTVTAVTVEIGPASLPACSAGNLIVTRGFSGEVVLPAHATRSLSALAVPQNEWPVLTMPDTSINQDACQHATFQLTYRGTGTMPS
jgi:hypothetical protein